MYSEITLAIAGSTHVHCTVTSFCMIDALLLLMALLRSLVPNITDNMYQRKRLITIRENIMYTALEVRFIEGVY